MRLLRALALSLFVASSIHAATIDFVPVLNAGNAPDTRYNSISVGSVGYDYYIGKYEVTAAQYTEFLNGVAKADPNGLYNTEMGDPGPPGSTGSNLGANIQRTGSSPNFSYSVAADWANRPVNWIGFWDAVRFANWLHNDQPTGPQGPGTTEDGAYHDVGNLALFGRNVGAKFFLPTEDEWYKAAYHDKSAGLAANYFDFPMGTSSIPGIDINETTNPGNNANFTQAGAGVGGWAIGAPYWRTVAGEFELSESTYGTFDQGGNVSEWNETAISPSSRGIRGGNFFDTMSTVHASSRSVPNFTFESFARGFRVASSGIPEPGSLLLAFVAFSSLLTVRRRLVGGDRV